MPDHDDLILLERAVRAAGVIALDYYGKDYRTWEKPGGSPVTEADLAVDRALRETLMAQRQDYGWLSEESADDPTRLNKDRTFVIDPIDGTIAFLQQRPHFTICAAVVVDGAPCCGIVFNPVHDELFAARTGHGATCNGQPIHVGTRGVLEGCRMLGRRNVLTIPPWPPMDVENRNSLAYRLVLVACDHADASVSLAAKRDWDVAAAHVILTESGGLLTNTAGQTLRYNTATAVQPTLVAAGPHLHEKILTLLRH